MKKSLMAALVAIIAFAAQATTINWNSAVSNATTAGSGQVLEVWDGNSLSVAAEITYGATVGSGTIVSFGQSGSSNIVSLRVNDNGKYQLKATGMTTGADKTFDVGPTANQTDVLGLSFYRNAQNATIEFSINGKVIDTVSIKFQAGKLEWLEWGRAVGNTDAYNGSFAMNVDYVQQQVSAADINYQMTVPEPTMLALLALGVAGLALKRKVA